MFGLFPLDVRKILLIIFVVALPLISINIQSQPGEAPWFLKPLYYAAGGVQKGYYELRGLVSGTTSEYLNLLNIKKENRELKSKIQALEAQLVTLDEVQKENTRLNELVGFSTRKGMAVTPARVIGFDLFSQYATIRLNKGTDYGIQPGMGVITPQGVVGTVLDSDKLSSTVLVVTDRYSVVDALIQRSRARGIVEGRTSATAQLKYLQRTDDVQVGDLVITSGLDPSFPKGFPVGKVTSVEKKEFGITQRVEVAPTIDPSRLEEVLVVNKIDTGIDFEVTQ